jgi:hypothetical protein
MIDMELTLSFLVAAALAVAVVCAFIVAAINLHTRSGQAETSIDLSKAGCSIRFKTKK